MNIGVVLADYNKYDDAIDIYNEALKKPAEDLKNRSSCQKYIKILPKCIG